MAIFLNKIRSKFEWYNVIHVLVFINGKIVISSKPQQINIFGENLWMVLSRFSSSDYICSRYSSIKSIDVYKIDNKSNITHLVYMNLRLILVPKLNTVFAQCCSPQFMLYYLFLLFLPLLFLHLLNLLPYPLQLLSNVFFMFF